MEQFVLQLVVLAHAYMIPALKRICTDSYERWLLNSDNVIDVLQISRYHLISRYQLFQVSHLGSRVIWAEE